MSFSQIQVITSMNRVQNLKVALSQLGVSGMTVIQAIGCGAQKGTLEYEPEQNKIMELLPKQMILIVVKDEMIEKVVETVKKELYTGHIGDGNIFVVPLTNIIRVRTGEEGENAL